MRKLLISIEGDTMLWTLKTDGTQYPWVTSRYQWGKSYRLTWRIFTHQGSDFDEQLLRRGGMAVRSDKYVYAVGAQATGIQDYQQCAENIVRGNLSLFREDGRATCAFVFPRRVNGESAHYADAYANDQDWALLYYLIVNNK